jgi:hypothetical protein
LTVLRLRGSTPYHEPEVGGSSSGDWRRLPGAYDYLVATSPDWHPLDREIEEMLDANPGLEEELDEMERLHEQGKLKLVEHDEVVARLRRLGVPLGDDEPADPRAQS